MLPLRYMTRSISTFCSYSRFAIAVLTLALHNCADVYAQLPSAGEIRSAIFDSSDGIRNFEARITVSLTARSPSSDKKAAIVLQEDSKLFIRIDYEGKNAVMVRRVEGETTGMPVSGTNSDHEPPLSSTRRNAFQVTEEADRQWTIGQRRDVPSDGFFKSIKQYEFPRLDLISIMPYPATLLEGGYDKIRSDAERNYGDLPGEETATLVGDRIHLYREVGRNRYTTVVDAKRMLPVRITRSEFTDGTIKTVDDYEISYADFEGLPRPTLLLQDRVRYMQEPGSGKTVPFDVTIVAEIEWLSINSDPKVDADLNDITSDPKKFDDFLESK